MKKIIVIKSEYGRTGGAETLLSQILESIDKARFQVIFVGISRSRNQYYLPEWNSQNHKDIAVYSIYWNSLSSILRASNELRNLIDINDVDILYTHDMRANLVAYMTTFKTHIPWVSHIHGRQGKTAKIQTQLYEIIDAQIINRADLVIVGSNELKKNINYVHKKKISVVPNSICIDKYVHNIHITNSFKNKIFKSYEGLVIGTLSRLHPGKGIDIFLKAVAKISKQYPEIRCIIIGEGSEEGYLKDLSRDLSIENIVYFTGYTENIIPFLDMVDIFVLPSLTESLPMALLEAMIMETPVIATDVGDIGLVMKKMPHWCTIKPGNVDDIKQSVIRLIRQPELRTRLGLTAKNIVIDQYSMPKMIENLQHILEKTLRNHQKK